MRIIFALTAAAGIALGAGQAAAMTSAPFGALDTSVAGHDIDAVQFSGDRRSFSGPGVRPGVVRRPGPLVRPVRPGGPVVVGRPRRGIAPGVAVGAGIAAGVIAGAAIAGSRPAVAAPPGYYDDGYVDARPVCRLQRRPLFDEYGNQVAWRTVRVCN